MAQPAAVLDPTAGLRDFQQLRAFGAQLQQAGGDQRVLLRWREVGSPGEQTALITFNRIPGSDTGIITVRNESGSPRRIASVRMSGGRMVIDGTPVTNFSFQRPPAPGTPLVLPPAPGVRAEGPPTTAVGAPVRPVPGTEFQVRRLGADWQIRYGPPGLPQSQWQELRLPVGGRGAITGVTFLDTERPFEISAGGRTEQRIRFRITRANGRTQDGWFTLASNDQNQYAVVGGRLEGASILAERGTVLPRLTRAAAAQLNDNRAVSLGQVPLPLAVPIGPAGIVLPIPHPVDPAALRPASPEEPRFGDIVFSRTDPANPGRTQELRFPVLHSDAPIGRVTGITGGAFRHATGAEMLPLLTTVEQEAYNRLPAGAAREEFLGNLARRTPVAAFTVTSSGPLVSTDEPLLIRYTADGQPVRLSFRGQHYDMAQVQQAQEQAARRTTIPPGMIAARHQRDPRERQRALAAPGAEQWRGRSAELGRALLALNGTNPGYGAAFFAPPQNGDPGRFIGSTPQTAHWQADQQRFTYNALSEAHETIRALVPQLGLDRLALPTDRRSETQFQDATSLNAGLFAPQRVTEGGRTQYLFSGLYHYAGQFDSWTAARGVLALEAAGLPSWVRYAYEQAHSAPAGGPTGGPAGAPAGASHQFGRAIQLPQAEREALARHSADLSQPAPGGGPGRVALERVDAVVQPDGRILLIPYRRVGDRLQPNNDGARWFLPIDTLWYMRNLNAGSADGSRPATLGTRTPPFTIAQAFDHGGRIRELPRAYHHAGRWGSVAP